MVGHAFLYLVRCVATSQRQAIVLHRDVKVFRVDAGQLGGDPPEVGPAGPEGGRKTPGLDVMPNVQRWNWGSWRILLDRIHDSQPDVVHIQYQAAAYAMHPAINFFPRWLRSTEGQRLRSVVTFHDLKVPYLFPKAGPLRRWVVNELARSSHAAITTNREDFEYLRTVLGEPPTLIPIGSNIQPQLPPDFDRDVWRARWGIGPDDLLLCFFGFINDRKGVDTLLDALNLLTAEANGGASPHLLFIGGQTGASDPTNVAYLAQIQAQINRLGLEQRVHWTGYVPDNEVSASFNAADLCVLPFRDGVSFLHGTLHAALVHGAAIITTRQGVISALFTVVGMSIEKVGSLLLQEKLSPLPSPVKKQRRPLAQRLSLEIRLYGRARCSEK